uniref:LAGLIDADG endonuclease n=1 Tax=Powellomyces hirtus TaxID=109895 RepID=A0A4P8NP68_9FUNG|nr:LAGLIDADG endonuclease [Powellomyces hirtus]
MKDVKSMVVGKVLGDAGIKKGKDGAGLGIRHSISQHEYVFETWLRFKDAGLVEKQPSLYRSRRSEKDRYTYNVGFYVPVSQELAFVNEWQDESGVKILPGNIEELLDPEALAYWIMDDGQMGSLKPGTNIVTGGLTLCTDNFTHEEVAILIDVLSRKWGLKTTPNKKGANLRIYFSRASMPTLAELVSPYMHLSMMNKIRH